MVLRPSVGGACSGWVSSWRSDLPAQYAPVCSEMSNTYVSTAFGSGSEIWTRLGQTATEKCQVALERAIIPYKAPQSRTVRGLGRLFKTFERLFMGLQGPMRC